MARVCFTPNLERHVSCPAVTAPGGTLREVLDVAFATNPKAKGYVLDDQGALRKHMVIFVDGEALRDRVGLSDPVKPHAEVYIMQALSGG